MKTKTMKKNEATAANTNIESGVIVRDPHASKMEKLGERFAEAAEAYPLVLAEYGWTPAKTEALKGQVDHLSKVRTSEAEARVKLDRALISQSLAQQAGETARDRLVNGFRSVSLRKATVFPPALLKVGPTSRHPERLCAWFESSRAFALKSRGQLTEHLGVDPIDYIDEVSQKLTAATRVVDALRKLETKRFALVRRANDEVRVSVKTLALAARSAFREDRSSGLHFRMKDGVRPVAAAKPVSSKTEESKAEEPKADEAKAKEPKAEDTKAQEAKSEKAKAA